MKYWLSSCITALVCATSVCARTPIQIANFAGSGLTISNVKVNLDLPQMSGASYTIKNNSRKTLLAYVSSLSYYWDTSPDKPFRSVHTEDGWFINGSLLRTGEQDQAEFTTAISPNKVMNLLKIVVSLDYAEFADGSTWGTADKQLLQKFAEVRQQKLDVEHQYADLLKRGVAPGEMDAKITADLQEEKASSYRRVALTQLQIALKNMGPDRFVQTILDAPVTIPHPVS